MTVKHGGICLFGWYGLAMIALLVALLLSPVSSLAANGDCAQPLSSGSSPTASDCLFILRVAVGSQTCVPQDCVCAPNGTLPVKATDALICLRVAVGVPVGLNCPCSEVTTTTTSSVTSTTFHVTTTTSTTTLATGGACPDYQRLTLVAGAGSECISNADCSVGNCDPSIGRCRTVSELDTGSTGISHDADVVDGVRIVTRISCGAASAPCGECQITGLTPAERNCRCANDNRQICDEPFQADVNDCGGAICDCYLGPPLPLSAGNTPACVTSRFASDISGTVNVDLGSGQGSIDLRSVVYLGESIVQPCPACLGDPVPGDGVRGGTCSLGPNAGQSCDTDGFHRTFPAPGGGGHSLDCFPLAGKNVSGTGLRISLKPSTGSSQLVASIDCGFPPFVLDTCHCGQCSLDTSIPCASDAECGASGPCTIASGHLQNKCSDPGVCIDTGGTEGECGVGPNDKFCDGIVRANGNGFIGCLVDGDCSVLNIGVAAGTCTVNDIRDCFLSTISAQGAADPDFPVAASVFCIPETGNGGINSVAGLPGPARIINQSVNELFCGPALTSVYTPGVGCP